MSIIAVEIGYRDLSTSPITTGTLYAATESFTTLSTDSLANTYFAGRVTNDITYRLRLMTSWWGGGGRSATSIGSIELANFDGGLDGWLDFEFRDQPVVIKRHTAGSSYNDVTASPQGAAVTLVNAIVERVEWVGEESVRVVIREPNAALVKPITTASYTSGDASGRLKPICFGLPKLCHPVVTDSSTLTYDVADGASGLATFSAVYDRGASVSYLKTSTGFQLLTQPLGRVAADPVSSATGTVYQLQTADDVSLTNSGKTAEYIAAGEGTVTLAQNIISDSGLSRASASGGKYYFEMYFDAWSGWTTANFTMSGSGSGDSVNKSAAVGLTNATPVHPQSPDDTGFWMAAFISVGAGDYDWDIEYFANSTAVASFTETADHSLSLATVGVLVNFDAGQITFRVKDTIYNAAAQGPHTLPSGTYSPCVGVAMKSGASLSPVTCSLRLESSEFVYSIPAGYSAWHSGDSYTSSADFSTLTTSISDRVSVSFDSTSVTTINSLAHSSPEVKYTYAYYLTDSTTPAEILDRAMAAIGGGWFVNRSGNVEFVQLAAPGSPARTITDKDITSDVFIWQDTAPGLTNGIGANKNWAPYRESEFDLTSSPIPTTAATRQTFGAEFQDEARSSVALAVPYEHATGAALHQSILADATAAAAEADRAATIYATDRKFYRLRIALSAVTFDNLIDEIGLTYTLTADRFGLSGGKALVLVGVQGEFLANEAEIILWG